MCDPVTATMAVGTALSAAGMVQAHNAQVSAAESQNRANNLMLQSANDSYNSQLMQLGERDEQIKDKYEEDMSARALEALKEQAMIRVASAESGLAGVSMMRQIGESEFNKGQDIASMNKNKAMDLRQNGFQKEGLYAELMNRHNGMPQPNAPSAIGTGLQIAGMSTSNYGSYQQYKATKAQYTNKG